MSRLNHRLDKIEAATAGVAPTPVNVFARIAAYERWYAGKGPRPPRPEHIPEEEWGAGEEDWEARLLESAAEEQPGPSHHSQWSKRGERS
jgi:hypothetical protein